MKPPIILFLGLVFSTLSLQGSEAGPPPATAQYNPEVEKLIDDLVNVATQTIGVNTQGNSGMVSKFLGDDLPPLMFSSGMPPYTYPPTPPTLRKIVELGVVAVPSLLAHLTDARATKLELLNPGIPPPSPTGGPGLGGVRFGSIMYNDEYDPRYRSDPARIPTTVNTFGQVPHGSAGPGDSYQVKVGDLCYVLLGQIVNRSLIAARYQATGSAVINSPIQNSALAEAARKDWANLTVEQHRASLEADATNVAVKHFQFDHFWSQHADAMERLAFYYPALAKGQALAMLTRPSADWHSKRATDFIGKLLAEPDATARDALLVAAQKQWGTPFILLAVEQFKRFTVETPPELADASAALPSDWTSVSSGNLLQHRTTNGTGTSITTSALGPPVCAQRKKVLFLTTRPAVSWCPPGGTCSVDSSG